ncbi:MAG: class I SAM-dependent methyltransferase [Deltaproteobacteria bacterium]|nr:class I SAM-dependent methyltransferase [Deltaproteobacteria bacterium]
MITVDFRRLRLNQGARVLDAGCGAGRHLSEAFRYTGVDVVGIDLRREDLITAKNTLKVMKKEGESGGGSWLIASGDITNLPFTDETFDCVICSEVLEHIPEDTKAIREIVRVLKTGKSLAVSVPRFFPERICWALSESYHNEAGGHVRIYKKNELMRLLESAGTRCVAETNAHALHSPYWWLKCLVGHKNDDSWLVKAYHRFLVWDIMKKPLLTRMLENFLNPFISKSIVLYLKKGG